MVKHNTAAEHTSSLWRCAVDSSWHFVIMRPLVRLHGSFNCSHLQRLNWPNLIYHVVLSKKIGSALSVNMFMSHGVKLHLHTISLFLLFFLCRSREVLCLKARVRARITLRWDLKPAVWSQYVKFVSQYDVLWHTSHCHGCWYQWWCKCLKKRGIHVMWLCSGATNKVQIRKLKWFCFLR